MARAWWRKHVMRIYHPNAREDELRELDVPRFIADCLATQAEAIVVNAGGIYAFYPSQVPHHYVSPAIGQRDLLGEIVTEAHAQGLRVIARMDFSKAREEVWLAHPEWFQRLSDGEVARDGAYYQACPLAGYQNADFALPVLREILSRYAVDGFHLNASGFADYCHCDACVTAFGGPIPVSPEAGHEVWAQYLYWRARAVANQLAGYYRVIGELNPACFFMAELAGPQDPDWARHAAHHLPALARSFSRLLLTAGGVGFARLSRWWVGLAAEQARAVRRKRGPIVNIKMQMRDLGSSGALMPPAEFAFYNYQALAHGAGLKAVTFGLPASQLDPRTIPAVAKVFSFVREQQEVLDSMVPIHDVALVWPEAALYRGSLLGGDATSGLRGEFLGLYAALKARHILVGLLYDELITVKRLRSFGAVILPTAVWLSSEAAEALASYVLEGGRLILLDSPAASSGQGFRPMPEALAKIIGGAWSEEAQTAPYMLPVAQLLSGPQPEGRLPVPPVKGFLPLPRALSEVIDRNWAQGDSRGAQPGKGIGPMRLALPYRRVREEDGIQVWVRSARLREAALPEELGELEGGEDPLVLVAPAGQGLIAYAATGLGQMYLDTGHEDYATILEAMISHGSTIKPYLLTNAPSSVEVTMAHWKLGVVVHLVNVAGPAPLDAPALVGPIELDLAWDGPAVAHLCAPGVAPQALRCREEWNRVKITVPRLNAYVQVVVRSG
jgi:hypothetical protein